MKLGNPKFDKNVFFLPSDDINRHSTAITPPKLQPQVLKPLREDHSGIARTKLLALSWVQWLSLNSYKESVVNNCQNCVLNVRPPKGFCSLARGQFFLQMGAHFGWIFLSIQTNKIPHNCRCSLQVVKRFTDD